MAENTSNDVWVMADLRGPRFFRATARVLSAGLEAARAADGECVAVLFTGDATRSDSGDVPCVEAERAADELLAMGASRVLRVEHPAFDIPRADVYAPTLAELTLERKPFAVLFSLNEFGRELAARASALAGAGLAADCVAMEVREGALVCDCPAWGGSIMARIGFADHCAQRFVTVQPGSFARAGFVAEPDATRIEKFAATGVEAPPGGVRLLSRTTAPTQSRDLENADVVVVGGAGLGSADGFGLARELARALGGQVGATRPPVLNHWVAEDRLIGQTGKSVRPRLLISVGTSGAIQYTAGITGSGLMVAVNRDPEAPIFQRADLGAVADARQFLPLLIEQVNRAAMRSLADSVCAAGETDAPGASGAGEKIRKLREGRGWSVEELAERTGQPPETVQQVETGEVNPSVSFLLRLSRALGVDPGTFLGSGEREAIRDQRAKEYVKRTETYSYKTLTPGAENEHLRAFMVTIESRRAHKPVAYKHEGEEYVFVMEGELELTLGARAHHLKTGESMRFNSETPHKLKSLSDEHTRCLVVLYTP
ncbi:MAG: FAD-binding protein [Desulfatibacillaceae bacterium]